MVSKYTNDILYSGKYQPSSTGAFFHDWQFRTNYNSAETNADPMPSCGFKMAVCPIILNHEIITVFVVSLRVSVHSVEHTYTFIIVIKALDGRHNSEENVIKYTERL